MRIFKDGNSILDKGIDVCLGSSSGDTCPAPYAACVLETVETKPGCWKSLRIGIFDTKNISADQDCHQIGEYTRNYHSVFNTFLPYKLRGTWYALYAENYTQISVMELPSCKYLGSTSCGPAAFCPVDFYVPVLIMCDSNQLIELDRVHGFVAGCVWGDDSSWKIRYLDLSQSHEGIITEDARFGYIELPKNLSLQDAIDAEDWGEGYISITTQMRFNTDGSRLH